MDVPDSGRMRRYVLAVRRRKGFLFRRRLLPVGESISRSRLAPESTFPVHFNRLSDRINCFGQGIRLFLVRIHYPFSIDCFALENSKTDLQAAELGAATPAGSSSEMLLT